MVVQRLFSVDPGDVHVGAALWELSGGRWYCKTAKEITPEHLADTLSLLLTEGKIQRVAYENFRLMGELAMQQSGSTMETAKCIGVAEALCRWHGLKLELVDPMVRKAAYKRMRAVQWGFPRGVPDHVWSAICVGAVVTGWSALQHFEGDGLDGPRTGHAPR